MDSTKRIFEGEGDIAKLLVYYDHVSMSGKSDEDKGAKILAHMDGYAFSL